MQPVFSPSGRHIAYWEAETGQRDLYTIPAEGGPPTAVTSDAALDWSPAWSTDGRYLYFSSDRGGSMNLWRIPMDERSGATAGAPEPVTAGVATAEQPSLSKDGTRIAFRASEGSANPIALSFDPVAERIGAMRQILDRTGILTPASVSPDGQWLSLWHTDRQEDVFIVRTTGADVRRLTDDAFRDRGPRWSPDGKELIFYSNRTGSYAIWAVRPDGNGLREVAGDMGTHQGSARNFLFPIYSPTGDRMVASGVRANNGSFVFDPRKGAASQTCVCVV